MWKARPEVLLSIVCLSGVKLEPTHVRQLIQNVHWRKQANFLLICLSFPDLLSHVCFDGLTQTLKTLIKTWHVFIGKTQACLYKHIFGLNIL